VSPLFAYGTFGDPAWRRAILSADYPAQPAQVRGWSRVALGSGYLSVVPDANAVLHGTLIGLDTLGWRIADAWEEVPRYARAEVVAIAEDGEIGALMYVHASEIGEGAAPFAGNAFAALPAPQVEAAIARFAAQMRALRAMRP
jgi:gamma-glutamylcyclotransferase (GGCT)/AIG2-like uncharacterized protein YtfP